MLKIRVENISDISDNYLYCPCFQVYMYLFVVHTVISTGLKRGEGSSVDRFVWIRMRRVRDYIAERPYVNVIQVTVTNWITLVNDVMLMTSNIQ